MHLLQSTTMRDIDVLHGNMDLLEASMPVPLVVLDHLGCGNVSIFRSSKVSDGFLVMNSFELLSVWWIRLNYQM